MGRNKNRIIIPALCTAVELYNFIKGQIREGCVAVMLHSFIYGYKKYDTIDLYHPIWYNYVVSGEI